MKKTFLFFFIPLVVIAIIASFAFNYYLNSNKTKILRNLKILNHHSLSFEETSISLFKKFPLATIRLQNVALKDSSSSLQNIALAQFKTINIHFSIQNWLNRNIALQSIQFEDGAVNMLLNEQKLFKNLLKNSKHKTQTQKPFLDLESDQCKVSLKNIDFLLRDTIKTTTIQGHVNQLNALLKNEERLKAKIDMHLAIKELTFKEKDGSFVANSQIVGIFEVEVQDSFFNIKPFPLKINEEVFTFSCQLNIKGNQAHTLTFENPVTNLEKVLPLLSDKVRKTLRPYDVSKPFYSKINLLSTFKNGVHPIVEVVFKLQENDVRIYEHHFKNTTLKGRFINRIFEDERQFTEERKRYRVLIDAITTEYKNFFIQSNHLAVSAIQNQAVQIAFDTKVKGKATGISDWLGNEQFFFRKGDFHLVADVAGPLMDVKGLLLSSNAELDLKDFAIAFDPANVAFPVENLKLKKKAGDAFFSIVNNTFVEEHRVFIDGELKNMGALLLEVANQPRSRSSVAITAPKISWKDFTDIFGENGYIKNNKPKTEGEKKKSMKASIRGFQQKFQPRLSIAIDTLEYYDLLQLHNFKSTIYFEDEHTLVLENTSFEYDKVPVDFNGRIDIRQEGLTPFEFELHTTQLNLQKLLPPFDYFNIKLLKSLETYPSDLSLHIKHKGILDDEKGLLPNTSVGSIIFDSQQNNAISGKVSYKSSYDADKKTNPAQAIMETQIQLEGSTTIFNDFFKTEQFFFKGGKFLVAFDYKGNIPNFEELLAKGQAAVLISGSEVLYKTAEVSFPLTKMDLEIQKDNANFNFYLVSDSLEQRIHFDGRVENLSELLIGNTGKDFKTKVNISSPKLVWQNFLGLFEKPQKTRQLGLANTTTMKATVQGMLNKFDPKLQVLVDTFTYANNFIVEQVKTGLRLEGDNMLILDNTDFKYHDGNIHLDGQVNIGKFDKAPFQINVATDNIDIKDFLENFDYFSIPVLQNMEELSGQMTMNLELSGILAKDTRVLLPEATKGKLVFDLKNVVIKGLESLDEIAAKLKMKKRFKEVRFAPISNEIEINGRAIEIPLMEVQSNALNFFVQGTLSFDDQTNIWLSIPIDNFKLKNRYTLPKKRGYAAAKKKIYVEISTDDKGETLTTFHTSKKKYYRDRGIMSQFRTDKRRDRRIRRALRIAKRRAKRKG